MMFRAGFLDIHISLQTFGAGPCTLQFDEMLQRASLVTA